MSHLSLRIFIFVVCLGRLKDWWVLRDLSSASYYEYDEYVIYKIDHSDSKNVLKVEQEDQYKSPVDCLLLRQVSHSSPTLLLRQISRSDIEVIGLHFTDIHPERVQMSIFYFNLLQIEIKKRKGDGEEGYHCRACIYIFIPMTSVSNYAKQE